MPPLWLIGMMGAGKSAVGRRLADRRDVAHVDLDRAITERAGRSVPELFAEEGERGFRERELAEVASIGEDDDVIVSTGGGVVLDSRNVDHMHATGPVVFLEASAQTLATRVGSGVNRPLLSTDEPILETLTRMLDERVEAYRAAATYVVDAEQSINDVVHLVAGCDRRTIDDVSEILIGPTLPRRLLPSRPAREQAVVVAHQGSMAIARSVMARLETEVDAIALVEVPDREDAKRLEAVGEVFATLASLNVGRHDTLVGVGGGTVTDVAGFVAATWLRGIEFVAVPTTVLGAVDAAIGGKTGINVMGKNLVGAFWHPSRVAISLGVLESLPAELVREGAAEAIKAGFLADPTIVELYRRHGLEAPAAEVVRRAVAVKAKIVDEDFREAGSRMLLNLGHTIGHGIEVERGMPHGHAVAVGMVAAAAVSAEAFGFDPALVVEPLEALGLPTKVAGADRHAVLDLIARDKKRTSEGLRMVLLRDVGDPVITMVGPDQLDIGLAAVGVT